MPLNLSLFRKQLLYETSDSAAQIRAHLQQLVEFDRLAQKKSKEYINIAAISAVIAVISFMLYEAALLFSIIGCLFAVGTIAALNLSYRWKPLRLTNLRCMLPQHLVEMLSRDMAKDAALDTRIDFSNATIKQKLTRQGPYPKRSGWKQAFYEDPWLHLKGQFLDSTTFDLTLIDHAVIRSGTKRGRSGKTKFKRKVKSKGCEISLALRFPRKKYGAISLLQADLPQAVSLPPGAVLKQIKANDHQLLLRVKAPMEICNSQARSYQLITQMFLSAYQALNLSKVLSKASA